MNKCNFLCELNRTDGIWSCVCVCVCECTFFAAIVPVTRAMDTHAAQLSQAYIIFYSTFGCSTLLLQDFLERHSRFKSHKTVSDFRFQSFENFFQAHTHTHIHIHCYTAYFSVDVCEFRLPFTFMPKHTHTRNVAYFLSRPCEMYKHTYTVWWDVRTIERTTTKINI